MIENILHEDKTLAIIIRTDYSQDGISFFTPDDFSQQLGYMKRETNYVIEPHVHNIVSRNVQHTQEVLFIKSGQVRVDFYDDNKTYLNSKLLHKGDVILLASGGHGFKMIEPSEIIEVKQGPYVENKDKTRFEPINESLVKIS